MTENTTPTLGLKRGIVKIVPYNSSWPKEFEKEKQLLLKTFGNRIIAIEHIGSTAIPGTPSKPIIDINVAIQSLGLAKDFIKPLQKLGYQYIPERWFEDRYFFPKGSEDYRTHYLNLVEITSDNAWKNMLLFRDYLITHSDIRDAYAKIKIELAARNANNREAYTEAKSKFVRNVINKAK
jgi:GrpB-like predicted nucleotidyltransferase (UPF0157 family)